MRGRASDQIRAAGRAFSPVYLEEILMRAPEVGNWFQFVVPARGGDGIKIRCELSKGQQPTAALADALAGRMRAATGATFEVELVEKLPRSPGKAARVVHE
jgi:phenylacetate-CoA ligase